MCIRDRTLARDFFNFNLPQDLFSTGRVDASRGPNAILFGMLTALLTIIPYVGILLSALLPMSVAWITTGNIWSPIGVVAVFGVVQYLEANLIFPKVVGAQLGLNTLASIVIVLLVLPVLVCMGSAAIAAFRRKAGSPSFVRAAAVAARWIACRRSGNSVRSPPAIPRAPWTKTTSENGRKAAGPVGRGGSVECGAGWWAVWGIWPSVKWRVAQGPLG